MADTDNRQRKGTIIFQPFNPRQETKITASFHYCFCRGDNNICGRNIAALRKAAGLSRNRLASLLQLYGLDVDKNAVQRIEAGKRFVTDIELVYLSDVLNVSFDGLLNREEINTEPIDK